MSTNERWCLILLLSLCTSALSAVNVTNLGKPLSIPPSQFWYDYTHLRTQLPNKVPGMEMMAPGPHFELL